jgi:AraC-like DNA-binding protein
MKGKAHEYAARYHAYEQQLEIQEKEAEAERSHIISIAVAALAVLAIAFAIYFFRQKRIVSEKNHALVRMINSMQPKSIDSRTVNNADSELFKHIDTAIRSERLYANIGLQRQDICDRFNISRHTLNDLLSDYTGGLSFPQYVNIIRLEEALRLLRDEPDKIISAIASEVGFSSANLREQFKRKYGMTPAEYRQNMNT